MESPKDRANLFDSRPLKSAAYNKLKDHLDPIPFKALVAIVAGESLPKGSKMVHLESVIRFFITELGWREDQPSPLENGDQEMLNMSSLTQCLSTQNDPLKGHTNAENADPKQTSARVSLLRVEIENETSQGNI